jgi:low affinity Fe/Cu permease
MLNLIRRGLTQLGGLVAHPAAFLVVGLYAALWYVFDPETLDAHAVVTLATLVIALLIQRSEYRDTQAIHAKLDELIKAQANASNVVARIDKQEPEDIERHRDGRPATDA